MKCLTCGKAMTSARENYNYSACGLPHVTLKGVEVRRCRSCGEHEVVIPRIEDLHQAIAMAVVAKKSRLMPAEVRFLRKHLGWSGTDFARHMGVAAETVSRWENGREPMGAVADRLLRLLVATKAPERDYVIDSLAELGDEATPARLRLASGRKGWRAEPAAA
ncbi:MAG: helix-turn-helix domain-containing protein [Deltaproteobacteria bacterium]|nr:helix-turn-helix domain-containing protein [Deltaproteobacteria bacterium]